jgi:hypothetical protein
VLTIYNEHDIDNAKNNTFQWDRKISGRSPKSKEVLLVSDLVNPVKDLGHSDVVGGVGGESDSLLVVRKCPSHSRSHCTLFFHIGSGTKY